MQEGTKPTGDNIVQDKEINYQPHIAEAENEKEDNNEVHVQEQHQMEEETNDTQMFGEQKYEEYKIADNTKVERNIVNNSEHEGQYLYILESPAKNELESEQNS
eukprot:8131594-Heterocapsa_arctica.AAC.1